MKKLLLIYVLFISLTMHAQRTEVKYEYRDNYDTTTKVWTKSLDISKWVNIFDNKNNIIEKYIRKATYYDNSSTLTKYKYDAKGHLIEQRERYSGFYFIRETFSQWQYTDFDSLAVFRQGSVNDSLKQDIISLEKRRTYDAKNRLSELATLYNNPPKQLTTLKIYTNAKYRYADDGLLSEISDENGTTIYLYDIQKQLIRIELNQKTYPYENLRNAFVYNSKSQLIEEISSKLDIKTNQWEIQRKEEYGYDANGNQNLIINSGINYSTRGLEVSSKQIYVFNEKRRVIKYSIYYFNRKLGVFELSSQKEAFYNKLDLPEKFIYTRIDYHGIKRVSTDEYQFDEKKRVSSIFIDSAYDDDIPGRKIFRLYYTYENYDEPPSNVFESYIIYPNPTSDMITVANTIMDNCLSEITLNDMSGALIAKFLPKDSIPHSIEPNNLCEWRLKIPENVQNGTYLVVMKNGNGQSIGKKIVVNR
jgi:hypothetical protein